jgi:hypothetical protein
LALGNAAIAFDNLVDLLDTEIEANNWILQAPPTNLVNPHVGKKWRDNSTSTFVLASTSGLNSIDTVMLAGVAGTVAAGSPTFRVRLSTVDPSGAAGNAHDSGSITGTPYFDADYGLFVYLLNTPVSARYTRVDITLSLTDYIEAGRMFVGLRNSFGVNFQAPWTRSPVRSSVDVVGIGGQTFVDPRRGYWRVGARFDFLSVEEREGFIDEIAIQIVNNGHLDMLWIRDPSSNNLSRDSVWGYLESDLTATQNLYIDPALFSAEFNIRQRL